MIVSAPDTAPAQRERANAREEHCHRQKAPPADSGCGRCRTRAYAPLSGQVASLLRTRAGSIAAHVSDTESGRTLRRGRTRAAPGNRGVGRCLCDRRGTSRRRSVGRCTCGGRRCCVGWGAGRRGRVAEPRPGLCLDTCVAVAIVRDTSAARYRVGTAPHRPETAASTLRTSNGRWSWLARWHSNFETDALVYWCSLTHATHAVRHGRGEQCAHGDGDCDELYGNARPTGSAHSILHSGPRFWTLLRNGVGCVNVNIRPRDVCARSGGGGERGSLHSLAEVTTMKVSVPNGAPPQRERRNANQQHCRYRERARRECRCRRDTRTRPALSRQVAAPERIVAGGVAADAV